MANKIPRSYAPGDNKDYDDKKKPGNEESQYPLPLVVAQPQQKHVAYVFYYYHSGSGRRSEWMTLCKDTMQCNFRSVLVLNWFALSKHCSECAFKWHQLFQLPHVFWTLSLSSLLCWGRSKSGALHWSGLHGKWSWDGTLRIWDWNCRGEHAPKACRKDTNFVLAADNEFLCDQISPCGHLVRRRMWYIGEFHIEAWNIALLNFIDNRFALAWTKHGKVMNTVG